MGQEAQERHPFIVIPPPGAIQREGRGTDLLLMHATGADKSIWRPLIGLLGERIRVTSYDRRGAGTWAIADGDPWPSVQDHAADAADLIESLGTGPTHVCGASFGCLIALELLIRRPELVRSAILFEPALACGDRARAVTRDLTDRVDRLIGDGRPEQAAEHFYGLTMGEARWKLLPVSVRQDMSRRSGQIAGDLRTGAAYRVDYEAFTRVRAPVLLLRGGRSRATFLPALVALRKTLPQSREGLLPTAAHVLEGGAWRELAAVLEEFCSDQPGPPA